MRDRFAAGFVVCASLVAFVSRVFAWQPPPQGDFAPATGPLTEPLPAAPLLIAAYAFVWVVVMLYVWSLWRRLNRVESEMRALEERRAGQHR